MPTLTLTLAPDVAALGAQREPHLCYTLLTIGGTGGTGERPVNWAFVADASKSMRIPIVDEAQFRALIRDNGAQETLIDGVPVWQLSAPVPAEVRATVQSPLEHVAGALHTIVEQLDGEDRFALIASADTSQVLNLSTAGSERGELARAIGRLGSLQFGDETDLASGIELGLAELRRGRDRLRADRLLLLTDGFTRRPERCIELAASAGGEGVAVSTLGIGGEFQEDLLTTLADVSGGQALFVRRADDTPGAVAQELHSARGGIARALVLTITPQHNTVVRRVTRIRPALSVLYEQRPCEAVTLRPGDVTGENAIVLLLELLAPAEIESRAVLANVRLEAEHCALVEALVTARRYVQAPPLPQVVRDAVARANIARLQKRAADATRANERTEAARLLTIAADRLDDLGAFALARVARGQAGQLAQTGTTSSLAAKELTYATRRLSEG